MRAYCLLFLLFVSSVVVEDPYLWLEDMHSSQTELWITNQNNQANLYFNDSTRMEKIKARLYEILDFSQISAPIHKGDYRFYTIREEGENQNKLIREGPDRKREVIIDPNLLSSKGTISLANIVMSENGERVAYTLSEDGSDQVNWHIDEEVIGPVKFSTLLFLPDAKGVYYTKHVEGSVYGIYYHELGTDVHQLVFTSDEWKGCFCQILDLTSDGSIVYQITKGCEKKSRFYLLKDGTSQFLTDAQYIDEHEQTLYFFDDHAILTLESTLLKSDLQIRSCKIAGDTLVCEVLSDCVSAIHLYDLQGRFIRALDLPGQGQVTLKEALEETFSFGFTHFTRPETIYEHNIAQNKTTLITEPTMSWNPDDFETEQFFIPSKDGTAIPIFMTAKKGIEIDENTPILLYGYGGFAMGMYPTFSVRNLAWLEQGGVYVSCCLRGGNEYGTHWHAQGRLRKKQNVFDDCIAVAEWLIANRYTSPAHLAITGRSNGGLLAAACLTQRPDLFGMAIPQVGVLDMLRFHQFTVGWAWMTEYGNPEDPDDHEYLESYSPYHNIVEGVSYPSTLITTADCDDRVVPLHSYKFAAKLQEAQGGVSPILLRVYTNTGHGAGRSNEQHVQEDAEILYFLLKENGR